MDEVAMDVVPVVFGSGKRYFGSVDAQHLLEDPHTVIKGDRVLLPRGMCGRRARGFAADLIPELVRTGLPHWGAHEEVERSRPETVALSDRLQSACQKVLERNLGGGVGSGRRCS
ncbi:hypothetical protein [Actinomadura sp. HBU206391]|uniref:hypothetical protein n=1 Tax=Actinomadura sp. HBU206391 TaxID=2731692 RepID=UPI001C9CF59D|nr:hypothetical protein [Actinomadura sp. HBU206391]